MGETAFPITFWYGVPPVHASLARCREIADAGFTIAQISGSPDEIRRQLDWCGEVGITGMAMDGRMPGPDATASGEGWKSALAAIVADYGAHPALWGYYLFDEPGAAQFAGLGKIVAELRRLDAKHPAYINLFPNYASEGQLGTATYDEHVRRYIDEVKPPLVSWDHYALLDDGTNWPHYFPNLRCVRDRSVAAGLDFWQIALAMPFAMYRDPGEPDLRWQAWTSLAYGAKGISWFTWWTPDGDATRDNFRSAIIDDFGERTAHYALVRTVNREIAKVGPLLAGFRSVGVVHGDCERSDPPRYLAGLPEGNCVIGEFERPDGGAALIVVNGDLARNANLYFLLRREFTGMRCVSRSTGEPFRGVHLADTEYGRRGRIFLAPGDGAILLLDR